MTMKKSRNRKALSKLLLALSLAPVANSGMLAPMTFAAGSAIKKEDDAKLKEAAKASTCGLDSDTILEVKYDCLDNGKEHLAADTWTQTLNAMVADYNGSASKKEVAGKLKGKLDRGKTNTKEEISSLRYAFVADGKIKRADVAKKFIDEKLAAHQLENLKSELVVDDILVDPEDTKELEDGKLYSLKFRFADNKAYVGCSDLVYSVSEVAAALSLEKPENGGLTANKIERVNVADSTPENKIVLGADANATSFYYVGQVGENTVKLGSKPTTGQWIYTPPKQSYDAIWSAGGQDSDNKEAPAITADTTGVQSLADAVAAKDPKTTMKIKLDRLKSACSQLAQAYNKAVIKSNNEDIKEYCRKMATKFRAAEMWTIALISQYEDGLKKQPQVVMTQDTQLANSALASLITSATGLPAAQVTLATLTSRVCATLTRDTEEDEATLTPTITPEGWEAIKSEAQISSLYSVGSEYLEKLSRMTPSEFIKSYQGLKKSFDDLGVSSEEAAQKSTEMMDELKKKMDADKNKAVDKAKQEVKQQYESQKPEWEKNAAENKAKELAPNMAVLGSKTNDTVGLVGLPVVGLAGGFLLGKMLGSKTQSSSIQQKALGATTAQGGRSASAPKPKTVSKP